MFTINVWNIHVRAADGMFRTNNSVEGWHRSFNRLVSVSHPMPCLLISTFLKEAQQTNVVMNQIEAGRQVARRPNSVYERVNSNLKCLIENYDEDNKLAFLRGVAHNIDF